MHLRSTSKKRGGGPGGGPTLGPMLKSICCGPKRGDCNMSFTKYVLPLPVQPATVIANGSRILRRIQAVTSYVISNESSLQWKTVFVLTLDTAGGAVVNRVRFDCPS